ncbi:unnamed protein product [Paramecium primaurelia]|uniref:Metalloendopeptidase n=1 Tax=Paramecium primaurelia TaxID=5886 RepID=A0A8S1LT67_PARPR|nr:unnamed protein product [Paramecium primaurelia]
MRQTLKLAISEFQEKTPIQFVYISDDEQQNQYVKYYRNEKVSSYVCWIGRSLTQKEHAIFINDKFPYGTYLHETMHVLGFEHEQCRQDRDNYVSVQFEEKDSKNLKYQYEKKGFMIGEYDPDSIMHYSLNRNMTSKGQFNNQQFGQRKQLSEGDSKGIQLVYGKSQCTYDTYGDKYMEQDFFECITCWGQDSGLLILKKSKSFYCDCGKYNHKSSLCTRQTTKFKRVQQSMYLCYDCFDIQKYQQTHDGAIPGVCYPCAKKCHKQHKLKFYQVAKHFYCDCGLKDCKTKCTAK